MPATPVINLRPDLSEAQRAALVQLLADDDPEIFRGIFETILAQGAAARPWLERHRWSDDPRLRRRVCGLIERLDRREADRAFLAFCLSHGEQMDLEEGALLLSRATHPEASACGCRAMLDAMAVEARERLAGADSPESILVTLNRYLFEELGFHGNAKDYYAPANNYLSCALDRRTGNPITLSVVYLLVCRRLELPMTGIGLPGHFVCRHQSASGEIFVDPFNGGRLLTRADCIRHLSRYNYLLKEEYLAPVGARGILMRTLNNLLQIHQQRDDTEETHRLRGYLLALARTPGLGEVQAG